MEKSCSWKEDYPLPRDIFYRAFIYENLYLLTKPKIGPLDFAQALMPILVPAR